MTDADLWTLIENVNAIIEHSRVLAEKLADIQARLAALEVAPRLIRSNEKQIIERDGTGRMIGTKSETDHVYA